MQINQPSTKVKTALFLNMKECELLFKNYKDRDDNNI